MRQVSNRKILLSHRRMGQVSNRKRRARSRYGFLSRFLDGFLDRFLDRFLDGFLDRLSNFYAATRKFILNGANLFFR
jgi:hypothetical protein